MRPHDHQPPPVTPQTVLWAYRHGIFPMAETRDGVAEWYCPDPRAVLPLDGLIVRRSLQKRMRRGDLRITRDAAFDAVIEACAQPRGYADETWINRQIIDTYRELHRMGHAHSVEAWQGDQLVGGLYGLAQGGAFFGESMFSRVSDASKICLVRLVEHLNQRGYQLLDTQIANDHMEQFGIIEIPQATYIRKLHAAMALPVTWEDTTGE